MRPGFLRSATLVALCASFSLVLARRSPAQATASSSSGSTSGSTSVSASGIAASAAPSSSGGLVAPKLLSSSAVDYPQGAKGDAIVVLLLTIDENGDVASVVVTTGADPFATAAMEAARHWKFSPAIRDGKAIRSKTRFSVEFSEPKVVPVNASASASASSSTTAPPKPKKGKVAVPEILVEAEKAPPTVTSLSKAEVRELPGAFGDPFRAIEALPGVTPIVSGLPYFYVRGAPPGNVGYFLDGVRVPYLFHVGLGPSVIHPGMVDHVDLYPGGYPARFGRFAGGIVSGETAPPRFDWHGEGNIRVFDAGALVESGFADGKGSVLIGGRYSYTAAIVSLIAKNVQLDYRDYQARVSYDVTPKDRLTLFTFGTYDLLGQKSNGLLNVLFGSEFYRVDMRWDHFFDKDNAIRYAITYGWDQTRIADQRNAHDNSLAARIELRHKISEHATFRSGFDFVLDDYVASTPQYADTDNPDTIRFANLFPPRTDLAGGWWFDFLLVPTPGVEVTPGVRADYFKSGNATKDAIDPRLSMRFRVTDDVHIVHAYGLAHQPPSFFVPVPGLTPGSLGHGLQTAFQTSAGVELNLPWELTGTFTGFHNAFFDMTDALGNNNQGTPLSDTRASGRAFGLEVFLRRRLGKALGGFLSYTLSRSTRTIDEQTYLATFDRTHVLNFALTYDLGRHWRAGSRLVYYTGAPKVISQHGLLAPPPTLSPDRDPSFYRIDLRVEKRWNFGERYWLAFVIEMLNATFHKETVQGQEIGPVTIPSVGIEGGF